MLPVLRDRYPVRRSGTAAAWRTAPRALFLGRRTGAARAGLVDVSRETALEVALAAATVGAASRLSRWGCGPLVDDERLERFGEVEAGGPFIVQYPVRIRHHDGDLPRAGHEDNLAGAQLLVRVGHQ